MRPSILVLGADGMLGSMVFFYLSSLSEFKVTPSLRNVEGLLQNEIILNKYRDRFNLDVEAFIFEPCPFKQKLTSFDYILNCIGLTKSHCSDENLDDVCRAIKINSLFPHMLSQALMKSATKLLHISTDGVFSGEKGNYSEKDRPDPSDMYGRSKSLGEVNAKNTVTLRCSIIGPQIKGPPSLLQWFLSFKEPKMKGYANHFWNGATTFQIAKIFETIIREGLFHKLNEANPVHHFVPNTSVSKYELLLLLNNQFDRNYEIERYEAPGCKIDRTLTTCFTTLTESYPQVEMKEAIRELDMVIKEFQSVYKVY